MEDKALRLWDMYQSGSSRPYSEKAEKEMSSKHQRVGATSSQISSLIPPTIRASTQKGFLIRLVGAILARSISCR